MQRPDIEKYKIRLQEIRDYLSEGPEKLIKRATSNINLGEAEKLIEYIEHLESNQPNLKQ